MATRRRIYAARAIRRRAAPDALVPSWRVPVHLVRSIYAAASVARAAAPLAVLLVVAVLVGLVRTVYAATTIARTATMPTFASHFKTPFVCALYQIAASAAAAFGAQRMLRTARNAALAKKAVRIAENAVLRIFRREKAERTRLRAKSTSNAALGDTNPAFAGIDHLVDLSHRTDRAPEIPVEEKPSDKPNGRRRDNHHVEEETPFANRRRTHDGVECAYKRYHDEERCLLREKRSRDPPPRVRQERIERAPRTEIAASMPSAVAKSPDKANRHVQEEAVCKIRIAPAESQHNHEQYRLYGTLNANLTMLFHVTYYSINPQRLCAAQENQGIARDCPQNF